MYNLINQIIQHTISGSYYNSEEQFIYPVCAIIILVTYACMIDIVYRIFHRLMR